MDLEGFYFPLDMKQPDYEGPEEQAHDSNDKETVGSH
jgi:hypothetical protein